jgi:hypothetical protein
VPRSGEGNVGKRPTRPAAARRPAEPLTGVCLVRVQWEGQSVRYRVVMHPDISSRREEVRQCRDLDEAMRCVRGFLVTFGGARRGRERPRGADGDVTNR